MTQQNVLQRSEDGRVKVTEPQTYTNGKFYHSQVVPGVPENRTSPHITTHHRTLTEIQI